MSTTTLTYREALRAALREELARDERVLLLGEDIGTFGGPFQVTKGLIDDVGERRVRDAPSAEAGLVGIAAGAAMVGLRPVVELMTITAAVRALDQLMVTVAQTPGRRAGDSPFPSCCARCRGLVSSSGRRRRTTWRACSRRSRACWWWHRRLRPMPRASSRPRSVARIRSS